eukprot:3792056-Pleurochrysis_carterae.AAC.2
MVDQRSLEDTPLPPALRAPHAPNSCIGSSTSSCHAQHNNTSKTRNNVQNGPASSSLRLRMPCATSAC